MSDPGYHSKYIEMQQEDKFGMGFEREEEITSYERSILLDISRIKTSLGRAKHYNHRTMLQRALDDAERRLEATRLRLSESRENEP